MDETFQCFTLCCVMTAVILHHIYSMLGRLCDDICPFASHLCWTLFIVKYI